MVGASGVRRHGTACSLEGEADNIKGDEDVVEQLRLEAREVRAEKHDRLGQGHVDGSRVKDGGNSEADWNSSVSLGKAGIGETLEWASCLTNLDHEAIKGKGIVPQHYPADISNNLGDATDDDGNGETPGSPSDTEIEVSDSGYAKENGKDSVCGERGTIAENAPCRGTCVQVTSCVASEGDGSRGRASRHGDGGVMLG